MKCWQGVQRKKVIHRETDPNQMPNLSRSR